MWFKHASTKSGLDAIRLEVDVCHASWNKTTKPFTVHVVTDDIDSGPVLGQRTVPVLEEDTVERLALRVQAEEHELYPAVLDSFINQAQLVFYCNLVAVIFNFHIIEIRPTGGTALGFSFK